MTARPIAVGASVVITLVVKTRPRLGCERVTGGAVCGGPAALAAREHRLEAATRDERARPTCAALGVSTAIVP